MNTSPPSFIDLAIVRPSAPQRAARRPDGSFIDLCSSNFVYPRNRPWFVSVTIARRSWLHVCFRPISSRGTRTPVKGEKGKMRFNRYLYVSRIREVVTNWVMLARPCKRKWKMGDRARNRSKIEENKTRMAEWDDSIRSCIKWIFRKCGRAEKLTVKTFFAAWNRFS